MSKPHLEAGTPVTLDMLRKAANAIPRAPYGFEDRFYIDGTRSIFWTLFKNYVCQWLDSDDVSSWTQLQLAREIAREVENNFTKEAA